MTTIYDYNDTMKIIGNSKVYGIISGGGIACNNFLDVCEAHTAKKENDLYSIGIDFFVLGYIYGKKAERAARAGHAITPLTPASRGKAEIIPFARRI